MARGMHRHRKIRLANLAATKIATRRAKAPGKLGARARRAARIVAKIKATPAGSGYSAEIQSWLSAMLKKPFSRISADEIAAVTA
jgi:hypothetical protein